MLIGRNNKELLKFSKDHSGETTEEINMRCRMQFQPHPRESCTHE